MQQFAPGLYTFTGLIVGRVYAIEDADGFTLIDASIPPAADKILKQLAAAGHSPSSVKRILITHAHPDHVGGLPALKAATGATAYTSALDRPVTEGTQAVVSPPRSSLKGGWKVLVPPPTKVKGTPVDRVIGEGDVLPDVMGGMQVLATPGHAPGHLAFWQPERKVLFCGDVVMKLFGKTRLPLPFLTVNMEEDKRSLKRLLGLGADIVCLGHGAPFTDDGGNMLKQVAQESGIL